MSFGLIQFTNRGRALQAKAQTGVRLVFTRIAVGDGQLSGQDISDLTALIHEIKSVTLNKYKTLPGGKAVVGGVLSNQDIVNGFWWRELGLFAMDPDIGEILYCYGNAGELAEYIPSPGGAQILEKQVDIISIIGNAQNVSAEIDQSLIYATIQDVNNLRDELNEHKAENVTQGDNPHGLIYEEGTWTPSIRNSSNVPYTLSEASGRYVRVGNIAHVWFRVKSIDNVGDPYYVLLYGLPYAPLVDIEHAGTASSRQDETFISSTHRIRVTPTFVFICNAKLDGSTVNFGFSDEVQGYFSYIV